MQYYAAQCYIILLSVNPTKWSNTLKQSVSKLPTNCLSVFDNFVKLVLKELYHNFIQEEDMIIITITTINSSVNSSSSTPSTS